MDKTGATTEELVSIAAKADRCSHIAMGICRDTEARPHLLFFKRDVRTLLDELRSAEEQAERLLSAASSAHQ